MSGLGRVAVRLLTGGRSRVVQISVPSASVRASSPSTPRYCTVFSILVWLSKIYTARSFPTALHVIDACVRRSEWVPYSSRRKPTPVTHSSTSRAYCRGLR